MKFYLFILLVLSALLVSCQNGGNAVPVGSGTSPFPEVKADCNNASCV